MINFAYQNLPHGVIGNTQTFGVCVPSSSLGVATMIKRPKYGNKKAVLGNLSFDSTREMQRYICLKDAEAKGIISNLELHPEFELIPKITEQVTVHLKTKDKVVDKFVQHPITYTADFAYMKDGVKVVEDVKISPKMLPKEFILKVKMMRYFHNISVRMVFNATEEI